MTATTEQGSMPPGSVIITPTMMYGEIRVMSKSLDHLASILEPGLITIRQEVTEVRQDVADHETRLRSLDKRVWIAAVVAAGSGVGISQIIAAVGGLT